MRVLALLLLLAGVAAQEPPEYPQGWQCTRAGINKNGRQTNEDPCQCVTVIHDELCEGEATEHNQCKQWCHYKKGKCGCPPHCEMPK